MRSTEHARRKTVLCSDVVLALKRQNRTLCEATRSRTQLCKPGVSFCLRRRLRVNSTLTFLEDLLVAGEQPIF